MKKIEKKYIYQYLYTLIQNRPELHILYFLNAILKHDFLRSFDR